jgi:hypothetical protein
MLCQSLIHDTPILEKDNRTAYKGNAKRHEKEFFLIENLIE